MSEEINWKLVEATSYGINIIKSELPYFRDAILENRPINSKEIDQKFQKNGVCDNYGNLTERGRVVAMSYLSLEEQCRVLGIKLEYKSIILAKETEVSVLEFYKKQGYQGFSSESEIISIILYCFCFNKLFPLHLEKYNENINSSYWVSGGKIFSIAESYSQSIGGYIEYFDKLKIELIDIIKNANERTVRKNFNEIFKIQYPCNQDDWKTQGIYEDIVIKIYNAIGNENFTKIGIGYFNDPFVYLRGWPDLTIAKNNKIRFIEVKIKDKLRRSQIITIDVLKKSTNLDISVLKII